MHISPSVVARGVSELFRRLKADTRGASIAEFAMVAPILTSLIMGIADGANFVYTTNAMHSGVGSASQYIMEGGQDLSVAQTIGMSTWPQHSANATMTVAKICKCASTVWDCSTLCASQTVPQAFVNVTAHDSFTGMVLTRQLDTMQEVRVR